MIRATVMIVHCCLRSPRAPFATNCREGLARQGETLWSPRGQSKACRCLRKFCRVNPWFRLYPIKSQC
jgi:hypothetical protein